MFRKFIAAFGVLSVVAASSAFAADSDGNSTTKTNHQQKNTRFAATLGRVDSQNDKITVAITGQDGKQMEKTLTLEKDPAVRDRHGKVAKLHELKPGTVVRITEDAGKVSEIDEENVATIAHVDAKKGTVTMRMPDESGKEVSRDFPLAANADYIDTTGRAADLNGFQAGDQVLFVESKGEITALSKTASDKTPNLTQRPGSEPSPRK